MCEDAMISVVGRYVPQAQMTSGTYRSAFSKKGEDELKKVMAEVEVRLRVLFASASLRLRHSTLLID